MADDADTGEDHAKKVAEREAERLRRRQRARHTFDEAFRLWARTSADEDEAVALQREAAAVQAAVPVAWGAQERCTGPEALALGVLIRAMEDALAGRLWAPLRTSRESGQPFSPMERAAHDQAICYLAHADAGLLSVDIETAKQRVSEIYSKSLRTAQRWWKEATDSGSFYDVPLITYSELPPEEAGAKRREHTESLEFDMKQLAPFVKKGKRH
jgi:hypothetical protein